MRSRQPRQAVRPGYTSGPTTPTPSRRRTARWARPRARSSSTIAGLGCLVGEDDEIRARPQRRGPRDGRRQEPPHRGLGGGQPLAAAIGLGVPGAEVGAAHGAAGVGVHGADAAVQQAGDDADGERTAAAHADHTARPGPGRPLRGSRVDQRPRVDQLGEQLSGDGGRYAARRGGRHELGGAGGPAQPVEQRGQRRRQAVDDERGVGIEPDDPVRPRRAAARCGAGRAAPGVGSAVACGWWSEVMAR